jgi:Icc-related predicted phosphoesterase
MRIVFISDTHNKHSFCEIPEGDIIIHCGDVSGRGTLEEITNFADWYGSLNFSHKVLIPGNHDFLFEKNFEVAKNICEDRKIEVLVDQLTEIHGIKIWGSPIQPWFCDWAFNRKRGKEILQHWEKIPEGIDILVTHGPPSSTGILSTVMRGEDVGCEDLYNQITQRVKPKISAFGHIHEGYGSLEKDGILFLNCSFLDVMYVPSNRPFVVQYESGKFTLDSGDSEKF